MKFAFLHVFPKLSDGRISSFKNKAHGRHTEGVAVTWWCMEWFSGAFFRRGHLTFILDVVLSIPKLMHVGLAVCYERFPTDALRTLPRQWAWHALEQNAGAIHTVGLCGLNFLFNVMVSIVEGNPF